MEYERVREEINQYLLRTFGQFYQGQKIAGTFAEGERTNFYSEADKILSLSAKVEKLKKIIYKHYAESVTRGREHP